MIFHNACDVSFKETETLSTEAILSNCFDSVLKRGLV